MAEDWWPLTSGYDPVPGAPDSVSSSGAEYSLIADAIKTAADALRSMLDPQCYESQSLDAVRVLAGKVADDISRAEGRYRVAGAALVTYSDVLRAQQAAAGELKSRAVAASLAIENAQADVSWASANVGGASTPADRAYWQSQVSRYQGELSDARVRLENVCGELPGVVQVWDAAAYRAAESIEQIVSSDTLHDSLWQNVRGFVHGLSKVMDWVGTVSGVLALVFVWLPPVSAAFGVVALGATAIKLVADVAIAANDHTGWGDVVWDAVGVVSFGAGRAVTRVAEGLSKVAVGTARQAANVSGRAGFAGLRAASGSRGALPTIRSLVGGAISRLSPKAAIGWVEGGVQVMRSSVVEGLNAYRLSSLWSDVRGLAHFSDELTYAGAWLTTELATMKSMGVVRALPGIFMRVLGEGGTAVNVAENVPSMAENVTALMQANGRALWKLEGVAMGAVNTGRQAIGYAVGAGAVVVGKVAGADVAAPLHSVVTYSGDSGPVETPVDRLNLK